MAWSQAPSQTKQSYPMPWALHKKQKATKITMLLSWKSPPKCQALKTAPHLSPHPCPRALTILKNNLEEDVQETPKTKRKEREAAAGTAKKIRDPAGCPTFLLLFVLPTSYPKSFPTPVSYFPTPTLCPIPTNILNILSPKKSISGTFPIFLLVFVWWWWGGMFKENEWWWMMKKMMIKIFKYIFSKL